MATVSTTSHRVDLGQAHFQTADSPLKLQLTATGDFKLPINYSTQIPQIEDIQLLHLFSSWVTEAPELELRLHFDINPRLDRTLSNLVSSLAEKMCSSKVWSDLGSTIVFKSCETFKNTNGSRISCLIFGMCRGTHPHHQISSRRVPSILRNPPGAHPPTKYPEILLAALDIYLEYSLPAYPEIKMEVDEIIKLNSGDLLQSLEQGFIYYYTPPNIYPPLPVAHRNGGFGENAEIQVADHWQFTNFPDLVQHHPSQKFEDDAANCFSVSYRLLDKSLRKLVLAPLSRVSQSDSAQASDSLEKMSGLAPAIFNPLYRQAMEQRAVSIPIISKAITSMVQGSQNPELRHMAGNLLQSVGDSVPNITASLPGQRKLSHAIQSSLWCIAQTQLRGIKNPMKASSFFDVSESTSPSATVDAGLNMLLEHYTYSNDELLESNTYNDLSQSTIYSQEAADWSVDWIGEDCNDINDVASFFEYVSDWDPTVADSLFSPCENLQSPQSPSSSSGMLLPDEDDDVQVDKDGFDLLFDF